MENTKDRFLSKIKKLDNGCWIWNGFLDKKGYGYFKIKLGIPGLQIMAHRASYLLFIGDLIKGLEIDHLCRNRACVNPEHLEQISHKENNRRSESPTAINARKTHCKNGHELIGNNLRIRKNGQRLCRPCFNSLVEKFRKKNPGYANKYYSHKKITD